MEKGYVEITVSLGRTINLGNFESGRADVAIRTVCPAKEMEKEYGKLRDWCDEKLAEEEVQITEKIKNRRR